MKPDTWLYHRTEAPRLVMASEVPQMRAQGWADTPAAFYEPEAVPEPVVRSGRRPAVKSKGA